MAHWLNAVDGNFNTKADWSTGRVPVYNAQHKDDAILDAAGGAYTVTTTTNEDVRSVRTAANATLSLTGATTFVVHAGTGAGVNAGAILVGDGATLFFEGGTVDNAGVISLAAGASNAFVNLMGAVTLTGGGSLVMNDSPFNGIVDSLELTSATLTNVDNTISGAGVIGSGGIPNGGVLTLVNEAGGVIDATGSTNTLIINTPGATLTNNGLLEGTGSAGLNIASTTVDGSGGGVIRSANFSVVRLEDATLIGGILKTGPTGAIQCSGQTTLAGAVSAVHNQGLLEVISGATLAARGVVNNTGEIELDGGGAAAHLLVAGNLTLTGGGVVNLGALGANDVGGASGNATLTNVDNTITGEGLLGAGQLTLINRVGGVIKETGSGGLVIDTGATTIVNAGRIVSTGDGITIESAVNNSGVIEIDGAISSGAAVLTIDATVNNTGKLVGDGGSLMVFEAVTGAGSVTISGGALIYFGSTFNQNVTFASTTGILELTHSHTYTKTVSGIPKRGSGDFLDLNDIAFVGAGQATYVDNGSHTGGVLTVTDGVHTSHIHLAGDYHLSTFGVQSDGRGGTNVFIESTAAASHPESSQGGAAPSRFVAAVAGFGAARGAGGLVHAASEAHGFGAAMLARSRIAMA